MIPLLERVLGWIAGASLFGMMALTFVDVLGRKLLDHSIPGSLELTELMMFGVIFAGLPLTIVVPEDDEIPADARVTFDPAAISIYADSWRVKTEG